MKKTIGFIGLISIFGCKTNQPLQTVANVDLNKYLGKWYEIAAFPQYFEEAVHALLLNMECRKRSMLRC